MFGGRKIDYTIVPGLTKHPTRTTSKATTRSVSAAAGVQPPTIYRQFGDMQGLLDVAARETMAVHVRDQATLALTNDPVEDLRREWGLHITFGLAHPDVFALLYRSPSVASTVSAIHEGVAVLQGVVARIAEAGRLRVDVAHATQLIKSTRYLQKLKLWA